MFEVSKSECSQRKYGKYGVSNKFRWVFNEKLWVSNYNPWVSNEKMPLSNEMVLMLCFYKAETAHYP